MNLKNSLLLLCLLISQFSIAQLCAVDYKSDEYAQFRASKTYFIKTGDPAFDNSAIAALEKSWKITSFGTVDEAELKVKIKDKANSFIGLILIGEQNHGYHYLALFNGGRKSISNYSYGDMLAYAPINHFADETELVSCGWRVQNMLEGMIQAMNIVQSQDIKGNTVSLVNGLRDYYNQRAPEIKKRTLLVSETSMGYKFNKAELIGSYPYKIEVCPRSKIEKAIADKSTEYYYLQPGITMNKSIFIIDPSNGEVMYFNYEMMGLNVNSKDIEKLKKIMH